MKNESFLSLDEALDYVDENPELSLIDIEPYSLLDYEREVLTEIPNPESEITGVDLEKIKYMEDGLDETTAEGRVALEHWAEIEDETLKKQLLSGALGESTGKAHRKQFEKQVKTSEAFERAYGKVFDKLNDPTNTVCPLCKLHMEQDRFYDGWKKEDFQKLREENLADETTNPLLKGGEEWSSGMIRSPAQIVKGVPVPKIMQTHIKAQHKNLWKKLETIFNQWTEDKDGSLIPSEKQNVEHLSNDQLAVLIGSDPEKRKLFFRGWLRKLQER